jgi:hypothetical protein
MNVMLVAYLLLNLAVAYAGRHTHVGALGTFLLSLFFTPLVAMLFLALFRPAADAGRARRQPTA